jgi:hypothetical protein
MVTLKPRRCAGVLLGALVLVVGPTVAPGGCAEPRPAGGAIAASVARLQGPARPSALHAQEAPSSSGGGSFIKSRRGVLAIVAVTALTGFVLYSAKHDRIRSSLR